jgi:hypothetical protein
MPDDAGYFGSVGEVQKSLMQSSKRLIESKIHQFGVGSTFKTAGMQDATAESALA